MNLEWFSAACHIANLLTIVICYQYIYDRHNYWFEKYDYEAFFENLHKVLKGDLEWFIVAGKIVNRL